MAMALKGIAKVGEECGELGTVVCKAVQVGGLHEPHWSGDLVAMAEDEMGDVLAAIQYATERNGLNKQRIEERRQMKYNLFVQWESEPADKPSK
jgi:hypothetical protein